VSGKRRAFTEPERSIRRSGMNGGYRYEQIVESTGALLDHLALQHAHSDRATWARRIAAGEVTVDDAPADPHAVVRAGQRVTWAKPPWEEPDAPLGVATLHEDEWLLAVDKPAGLPTLPGGGFLEHTLLAIMQARTPGAIPMHRLGRGTSGVVLFAKDPDTARDVQGTWQRREVDKVYRALVGGTPTSRVIDERIGLVPDPIVGQLYAASPAGKEARSHVTAVGGSLVDVRIETGRPHQIRIHLAVAGWPLVGDPLYGVGGVRAAGSTARPGDVGYLLHAWRLGLIHPRTHERIAIEAPLPVALC
jgi:23S rRNA pseudouridine1911/1915/1917 synthase